jgi:hypothetical protein
MSAFLPSGASAVLAQSPKGTRGPAKPRITEAADPIFRNGQTCIPAGWVPAFVGRSGGVIELGEAEKIRLRQSLVRRAALAANRARNPDKTGGIEIGQLADLPALAPAPFKIPVTRIHENKVKMTLSAGETVSAASASARRGHRLLPAEKSDNHH